MIQRIIYFVQQTRLFKHMKPYKAVLPQALTLLLIFLLSFAPNQAQPVHAAPIIAPPNLTLTGTCDGAGNSVFTIKNLGGAMTISYTWEIYQNGVFLTSGT